MNRLVIAAILVLAALGGTNGQARAASQPLLPVLPNTIVHSFPGDWLSVAVNCFPAPTNGTCGEVLEAASTPGMSDPTTGVFVCFQFVQGRQTNVGIVAWGRAFGGIQGGAMGLGGVQSATPGAGPTSLPPRAWIYSNISAVTTNAGAIIGNRNTGMSWGGAVGALTVNNQTQRALSGSMNLSISGTLFNTSTGTVSQGTINCLLDASAGNVLAVGIPQATPGL